MQLVVTTHAAERYVERVKPHLTVDQARAELLRLFHMTGIVRQRPEWLGDVCKEDVAFMIVVDAIVLPLSAGYSEGTYVAKTCVTRNNLVTRSSRAVARERKRAKRKASFSRSGRRPRMDMP